MASNARKDRLANIAYANVAGMFATFHNDYMRGPNFSWDSFIEICENDSEQWVWINFPRHKQEDFDLMKEYAVEISKTLLKRAGYTS